MRKAGFSLLLFAFTLILPLAAHADGIDDFVLTGAGNTITFSLPSSPGFSNSLGAGGAYAGFFVTDPFSVTINGQTAPGSIEFYSGQVIVRGGFTLFNNNLTVDEAVLYNGSLTDPTFLTGSFNLRNFYGSGDPYLLTITPETATVPEPSPLLLLLTGSIGLIVFKCLREETESLFIRPETRDPMRALDR